MLARYTFFVSSINILADVLLITNTYTLTANAQIWPCSLNYEIDGSAGLIYLVVQSIGTNSGSGFDFVMGLAFLQRFYSMYDITNSLVGFATTPFTNAYTN